MDNFFCFCVYLKPDPGEPEKTRVDTMRSPSNLQVPKKIEIYKIVEMLKKETTKEGIPQVEVHFFYLSPQMYPLYSSLPVILCCAHGGGVSKIRILLVIFVRVRVIGLDIRPDQSSISSHIYIVL